MRCSNCGKSQVSGINKYRCWTEERLCGMCSVILHPEKYNKFANITPKIYEKKNSVEKLKQFGIIEVKQ